MSIAPTVAPDNKPNPRKPRNVVFANLRQSLFVAPVPVVAAKIRIPGTDTIVRRWDGDPLQSCLRCVLCNASRAADGSYYCSRTETSTGPFTIIRMPAKRTSTPLPACRTVRKGAPSA